MKKSVQTNNAPAAIGPYSQAIVAGPFVFCSGQVPIIPPNGALEEADIRVQTRRVLSNVKAVLEAAGCTPAQVVKTTVFLTDLGNFAVFNEEYGAFFEKNAPGVPPPARSTIQVSALPRGAMVEVEATAILV